jgi:hypothetical protein
MVAAPHQNDVNKWVYTVQTQELNWVQNNSIFLDSIVNLKQINKIPITALFVHNMGMAYFDYNNLPGEWSFTARTMNPIKK